MDSRSELSELTWTLPVKAREALKELTSAEPLDSNASVSFSTLEAKGRIARGTIRGEERRAGGGRLIHFAYEILSCR
jgi:hypothetical protein